MPPGIVEVKAALDGAKHQSLEPQRGTLLADALTSGFAKGRELTVQASDKKFQVVARIDTPKEIDYYRHGGILPFVLRQLVALG